MNRVGASRMGSSHLQRPTSSTSAINVKREEIIIDSDSEPDVIMLDGDSDSDIEFVGVVSKQNRALDNGKSIPILNGTSATSIIPLDTHSITQDLGVDTDEESLPEGFELWDPTTPVRSTVPAVAPNHEIIQNEQPEMQGHLGREAVKYMETAVLYSRPMTRIPGMNAPRGAVNYIAQSKGYVAVGRTYEESAAYDGGGLVLWKVKDQRARDLPAHITESRTRRSDCDMPEPGRRQHSIVTLSFDPTNHLSLLSAGHDGTIQHWYIDEDEDTVEYVGTAPVKEPGCMEFHPGGGVVAFSFSLKLFATGGLLEKKYHWYLKKKGQNIVNASWGAGRSRDNVVCGAQADDGIDGKLVLIDGQVGQCLVSTDSESCCTVSVDPIGTRTAFTGSGRGGNPKRFVLRLYDPQRMGWKRIAEIGIPSSKSEVDSEIIDSAWSPDGIQLACSRADNSVNVLDTRWLGQKGCMRVFRHDIDQSPVTSADSFGVQGVVWFGSETLVSGGADHCVRVWDTRRSESGRVIARLGGGIGCLIGSEDPQLFPLIAGDLLGNVHYLPNPQLVRET
ncbi:WD40 domain-containing protein [Rhizoctonia solani]|uniref:WD40 domain-containing protein n=1 Tax=Rhizoctonia solani TaxID=456999 RepID=A0A8H8NVH1_9AGAM|nr:WD40 domain-containing protein [Rhizoctonia solani]QRW19395.1 WD40 domain-containing protein [Rhizoctonia solani]